MVLAFWTLGSLAHYELIRPEMEWHSFLVVGLIIVGSVAAWRLRRDVYA